jgi:anti-sigma factor RsiW
MRGHTEITHQLAIYRSLNEDEQRAVDAHVRTCSICTARQAAYVEMDGALARLQDPLPPVRLARALGAIARGEKPASRTSAQASDKLLWPRRVFVPVGLALLLIFGVWLVTQLATPVRHEIAETPSVTPTATPLALASPQLGGPAASDRPDQYATRRPERSPHDPAANLISSAASLAAVRLTPAVLVRGTP